MYGLFGAAPDLVAEDRRVVADWADALRELRRDSQAGLDFARLWVNVFELPNHVFRGVDSDVQVELACIQYDADCYSHQPR